MLMAENRFRSCQKAELLVQLLKDRNDYPMRYYIDAAKNYDTFEDAQSFLNQPCPICGDTYLMDDVSLEFNYELRVIFLLILSVRK